MCGIAGIVAFDRANPPTEAELHAMNETLVHRGPDDAGVRITENVGLAMRRLAIIDLSGGHQPMTNEDGGVSVVFNGEIYNHRALRTQLQQRGHRFATASDTEVIVHLWEEHGEEFANHLNGMFAIALHDRRNGRFVLVRDHLGIKPVFYALNGEALIFGSEIKALLASGRVQRELDVDALGQFMSWEYIPGRGTLFKAIRKLEPGHMLIADVHTGDTRMRQYWDVPIEAQHDTRSAAEWESAIDERIRASVRQQMVSDVPLGAFLSGGVDSSLVVAAMGDARTFSIGFDDPSYNELSWARAVAGHLGVRHESEVIQPRVAESFDHLMHHMDDPIGDFSIFPTYLVSRYARRFVTVALTGDGGDELFGGYETYIAQERARQWRRVPATIREHCLEPVIQAMRPSASKKGLINKAKRFVEGLEHDDDLGHARWRLFVGQAMREELFTPEAQAQMSTPVGDHVLRLARKARALDPVNRALYIDVKSYLVDNCLVKTDRMSMAASLEARVPLLDRELVELAFAMPARLKMNRGVTKPLLKRVAARHVPRQCVYRSKQGFSIPIKHWLKGEFRPLVEELLDPRRLEAEGLFNVRTVERLKAEHLSDRANHSHVLWSMIVFEDWRRRWMT